MFIYKVVTRDCNSIVEVKLSNNKICNYDCIYCDDDSERNKHQLTQNRQMKFEPEEVFKSIKEYVNKNGLPDFFKLGVHGEPGLYSALGDLSRLIKEEWFDIKLMLSTNGSMINNNDVKSDFYEFDYININLSSFIQSEYSKINQPQYNSTIKDIYHGLKNFNKFFKGYLNLTFTIVEGINDNQKSISFLSKKLETIKPDSVTFNYFVDNIYNTDKKIPLNQSIQNRDQIKSIINEIINKDFYKVNIEF